MKDTCHDFGMMELTFSRARTMSLNTQMVSSEILGASSSKLLACPPSTWRRNYLSEYSSILPLLFLPT